MNNIAMLRKERKLSQKELGTMLGVAQNTICNWENGKREPDFLSLKTMASYFHCSIDYLLGLTEQEKTPTPEDGGGLSDMEQLLMQYVHDLTEDQQEMLLAQMQVMKKSQKESSLPFAQE